MFLIMERQGGRDWFLGGFTLREGEILPVWQSGRDYGIRFPLRENAEETRRALKVIGDIIPF